MGRVQTCTRPTSFGVGLMCCASLVCSKYALKHERANRSDRIRVSEMRLATEVDALLEEIEKFKKQKQELEALVDNTQVP